MLCLQACKEAEENFASIEQEFDFNKNRNQLLAWNENALFIRLCPASTYTQ
jgi:hypothetical protein